jgi:hypothetical protein
MIIYKGTTHAYYPMFGKRPDLILGSGRIRYARGFIVVNTKESGAETGWRSRQEKLKS